MSAGDTTVVNSSIGTDVFRGYLSFEGLRIDVDFQAPVGASSELLDSSFLSALAQKAEINYLAIGEVKGSDNG